MDRKIFLFEMGWEVCNKVGGIYTVLRTKAKYAMRNCSQNYILIGPWLENNKHFVEITSPFLEKVADILAKKGLRCRIGYWDIGYGEVNEQPIVILVAYKDRYKIDVLLYELWSDYGVDSLASNFDYYEPILFSTAGGEVIRAISENLIPKDTKIVTHCHEWLCGAGILYLKKYASDIVTIFTTHATVLGRSLSGTNRLVYDLPKKFDPDAEAKISGVFAKHSMESSAAKYTDAFTTVSEITGNEANVILRKYPDKIVANGLDMGRIRTLKHEEKIPETRTKLLKIAGKIIGKELQKNSLLWLTSGRYEFHNKGYDTLLTAIAQLESQLSPEDPEIVVFFLIAASHHTKEDSLLDDNSKKNRLEAGIATHKLYNPSFDPIVKSVFELNLKGSERKIHVVFSDAYLNGSDGVFDTSYEQILASSDLSLFLSFYEPWGYTPLESIAYATPTITTDLAGFGSWITTLEKNYSDAVYVLKRKNKNIDVVINDLCDKLLKIIRQNPEQRTAIRQKAVEIANLADWEFFFKDYLDAYDQAIEFNEIYYARLDTKDPANKYFTLIHDAEITKPRFRIMQHECVLPEKIKGLRDIAYNFWWSWHESVKFLFQAIDPILWDKTQHNPVYFLNSVSQTALNQRANDESYLHEYNNKLQSFYNYCNEKLASPANVGKNIDKEHPIAYFCMEYGLDECLPIYSGGLGILAGDFLKTMSDMNVPMIAIGIFYKQGYFKQSINFQKEQIALYETQDSNQIPMKAVNDAAGEPILISVEILERTVHARVWEIKIGRIILYLLDTDVSTNNQQDRQITNKLYAGSKETRLIQEIILGIGGEKLLSEKLNIKPSVYHLNEGHSAFLLLERIKNFARAGLSFNEASEIVRASSVFTTHTSVPEGNEVFYEEMIKKYFSKYQEQTGISLDDIVELARNIEQKMPIFSMTALAFRLTTATNAVSRIHSLISRDIWKNIWPGLLEYEIPIENITNGIHLSTWIGNTVKNLFDNYLGSDWKVIQNDRLVWNKVASISNKALWDAHQMQKEKLLDEVREAIVREYPLRNESKKLISSSLSALDEGTLLIGLARRMVTYKRNNLIIRDRERLTRIVTNEQRPIVLLVAGKAHPVDLDSKNIVQDFIRAISEKRFNGHIIFLEEYDMALAKLLTQGVDIWLNTPILGREACGTSGMKVALNGGLNFSVRDGWWDEAYDPNIGWNIESFTSITDFEQRDDMENMYLLDTLEYSIAPLYYDKHQLNFNPTWVEKMKASMAKIGLEYNSQRMANAYIEDYRKVADYAAPLEKNNFKKLKEIVSWKEDILDRFNTVKIKTILINGVKEGKIMTKGLVKITALIFSGKMKAHELKVELILAKSEEEKFITPPMIIPLNLGDSRESGILTYNAEYTLEDTGFYSYGIRVLPTNKELLRWQDLGLVYWG